MQAGFLRPAISGLLATFVGIGLARFAYVPLFPVLVAAGWVDGGGAALLGASNLTGYLAGVMMSPFVARRLSVPRALDFGMGLTMVSFAACGFNGGLVWLSLWRFAAGISGGILMTLAGPSVQAVVAPQRRGAAGGMVMAGVGCGIMFAGFGVPLLVANGVSAAWLGLAAMIMLAWAVAHWSWPQAPVVQHDAIRGRGDIWLLVAAYGIAAAGMVPHMVYLADLAVRGYGLSLAVAAVAWVLFGLGGLFGTLTAGRVVDRIGGKATIRIWYALLSLAVGLAMIPHEASLLASSLLGGFGGVGATAVVLARARELADGAAGTVWQYATASFAVFQAAASIGLAAMFAYSGAHVVVFGAGLACSLMALGLVTLARN